MKHDAFLGCVSLDVGRVRPLDCGFLEAVWRGSFERFAEVCGGLRKFGKVLAEVIKSPKGKG